MRLLLSGCIIVCALLLSSCSPNKQVNNLIVFYAACFAPVIDELKDPAEETMNINIRHEVSGSQVVCRKVTELVRECDLMMLADTRLFAQLASSHCSWRIDFAHDEIVLGVGLRARKIDETHDNWVPVLLDPATTLGRVDENLGPIGYRTLLVWKLMEQQGNPGLTDKLIAQTAKKVEHVGLLATLLKAGDIDYGFLYKTTCIKYDIRYIPLSPQINLGSSDVDYSTASVTFDALTSGEPHKITVTGAPITYGLTVPDNAPHKDTAHIFIRYMLRQTDLFEKYGFTIFAPKFYGSPDDFSSFKEHGTMSHKSMMYPLAEYAGEFR